MYDSAHPAAEAGVEPTPAGWSGRITDLDAERQQAERELVQVIDRRRKLAGTDHAGDRAAAQQAAAEIAWLNQRHRELLVTIDNHTAAQDSAAERLGATLEARQRGYGAGGHGDPPALAKAILAQAERIDGALAVLADALGARTALARRLAGCGGVNFRTIASPARIRGALGFYGLPAKLDISAGPARLHARLAEADRMILHHWIAPPRRAAAPAPDTEKDTAS